VRPAVEAERAGIPCVVITTTGFTELARITARASGLEDLPIAEYPGAIGTHHPDDIREKVKGVLFDKIINGLTKPRGGSDLTSISARWVPKKIVFSGTSAEVNTFFSNKGWTDGLPIIPPTIERVKRFLKYTNCSPNEEIARLPPENLMAVPWNIAANAVMAGCRPESMPIFIASVEAIGDETYNLNNIGTTFGLFPYLLINGPIIKQLGIEYSGQLICRGPNPAIGRALGLIIKNIAGYRPGENYMGTFGYPLVFALAENEEESPWEPFHVEHGFDRKTSTVTVGITAEWGSPADCHSTLDKTGAQTALEALCKELTKKVRFYALPERGPDATRNMITLLISPSVAKSLADAGYSKQDIKDYLYENARIPLHELEWSAKYGYSRSMTVRERIDAGLYSEEYLGGPDDMVRLLSSPAIIHIIVCGDPGRNRVMSLDGAHAQPTTKEIKLPVDWDELFTKG
jgi:hypothetical protein